MKVSISSNDFVQAFRDYNRADQFSSGGLIALYELFEDIDPDFELDVIGICCDFTEYESLSEFRSDYGNDYQSIEDITEQTLAIELDNGGIIIQAF